MVSHPAELSREQIAKDIAWLRFAAQRAYEHGTRSDYEAARAHLNRYRKEASYSREDYTPRPCCPNCGQPIGVRAA